MTDPTLPADPAKDKPAKAKAEPTAKDVAALIGGAIRDHRRDKNGAVVRDDETGRPIVEERKLTAADILSFRQTEAGISAVLADGRRIEAARP